MLCSECQKLLKQSGPHDVHALHSKICSLWPFGFYERLCLLGLSHLSPLESLFSSYDISFLSRKGDWEKGSAKSLFHDLGLVFAPMPNVRHLLRRPVSLPSYFLVSEQTTSFLCTSLTTGWMKKLCERVEVRWKNSEVGFGLFLKEPLETGEYLGVYSGEVKKLSYFSKKSDLTYTAELIRSFPWRRPLVVDAKKEGSLLRFINHKDEPNVGVEYVKACSLPFLLVSSLRRIEAGEEIFLSYGTDFWKNRKKLLQP